jgi:hypothetical protein
MNLLTTAIRETTDVLDDSVIDTIMEQFISRLPSCIKGKLAA